MKKDSMSLMSVIKEDPDFVKRIKQVAKEIDKDTAKIKTMADKYNTKYKKEIEIGTAKKHLLLQEAKNQGKSIEEVQRGSGFIPSVYTPILNWLYFFIIEGQDFQKEYTREEQDGIYRQLLQEEKTSPSLENAPDMLEYIYGNLTMEKFQTLKKLKRLSKSPNEHEAFRAYRKCMELCKEHKIDFDRIPD